MQNLHFLTEDVGVLLDNVGVLSKHLPRGTESVGVLLDNVGVL